ncbi:hypothetical protein B7H23_05105 [Notoacmeibacter marinus]|uniref:Uncharacterized protein n=1 Tax=Notoacmeibacter marinus TaxID=1876515 RepID=A0A231V2C6_9HYPH|nr:hypothetical protein [Notoacmeibacter marinus]OXT02287.1 hypothetical protein B7H23_05105 [Notoacmeibacter marinus]
MDDRTRGSRLTQRFDSEDTILDALETLHREGVAISELENCLVRIGPTDLDLLSDVLARLRQTMAANDQDAMQSPAQATMPSSTRTGRFAPSR